MEEINLTEEMWSLGDQEGIDSYLQDVGLLLGDNIDMLPYFENLIGLEENESESWTSDIEIDDKTTGNTGLVGLSETIQNQAAVVLQSHPNVALPTDVPVARRRKEKLQPRAEITNEPSPILLKSKPKIKPKKQFLYNKNPSDARDAAEARRRKKAADSRLFRQRNIDAMNTLKEEIAQLKKKMLSCTCSNATKPSTLMN